MQLVSIVLPLYMSERYVLETINSVLAQTYSHWELIIVDDGSPDRSAEICRTVADDRIHVFSRQNTGSCRARNFGIAQARGALIAFIDHDDLWLPEKLERHVSHLSQAPEVGVSYGPSEFIDAQGQSVGFMQVPKLSGIDARDILCRNPVGNGSVPLIRREVLDAVSFEAEREGETEIMYFDDESVGWEDVELWFRIISKTSWKFEGVPDCLTLYRIVPDSISGRPEKKQEGFERGLARARRYAPDTVARYEAAARAYHLRFLARRLIGDGEGARARHYAHRALASHPALLLEEPGRTLTTVGAAWARGLLPDTIYARLRDIAVRRAGAEQSRKVKSH